MENIQLITIRIPKTHIMINGRYKYMFYHIFRYILQYIQYLKKRFLAKFTVRGEWGALHLPQKPRIFTPHQVADP